MIPSKKDISMQFANSCDDYDKASVFHAALAGELANDVREQLDGASRVLEIGSHTGLQTAALLKTLRMDSLILSDLHPVAAAYRKGRPFVLADGEALPFKAETFDLIVSGSVFQWFHDFPGSLKSILQLLKPGGHLAFSMFVMPTLSPLRDCFDVTDGVERFLPLLQAEEVREIAERAGVIDLFNLQTKVLYFENLSRMGRFLKKMGVTASGKPEERLSRRNLMRLRCDMEKNRETGGLPLTLAAVRVVMHP